MHKKENKKSKAVNDSYPKENKNNISQKIEKIADMKDMERVVLNSI